MPFAPTLSSFMPNRFGLAIVLFVGVPAILYAQEIEFSRHVSPMLYQLGCSAGQCHGSFSGKGGFRLSLFAGSPEMDYQNIRGGFNRRLDAQDAEKSLLLLKPTGQMEHGGAVKLRKGSWQYEILRKWIAGGARYDATKEAKFIDLRIDPPSVVLPGEPSGVSRRVSLRKVREHSPGSLRSSARLNLIQTALPRIVSAFHFVLKIDKVSAYELGPRNLSKLHFRHWMPS
jgi:hypothetical protein